MSRTSLVVPCYNEAARLDLQAFQQFAKSGSAQLVLVNDGSRDDTLALLEQVRTAAPDQVTIVDLARNSGKAEAVRRGMLEALAAGADYVGFWDADLATPFIALRPFVEQLEAFPHLQVVIGSRVRLLGRTIDRQASRHYAGRVFATAASLALRLPVYDTQCGAKLFRASSRLKQALAKPFMSKWVFDVELLARLGATDGKYVPARLFDTVYEYPLAEWRDVAGSKLHMSDFAKSALDLLKIYRTYVSRTNPPQAAVDDLADAVAPAISSKDPG